MPSQEGLLAGGVARRCLDRPRSWAAAFVLALAACASGAPPEGAYVAAAQDRAAQRELRELEDHWAVASSLERQKMRAALEDFVRRYADDPSSARARLLLVRSLLLAGQATAAESALAPVLTLPASLSRDEATIVLAAIRHHQKRAVEALDLLEPLSGKLVTDEARREFSEIRIQASLAARRWRLAVDTMVSWVDDAGARADDVRSWVGRALVAMPDHALARVLEDWSEGATASEGRTFVKGVIVRHLAKRALETEDPRLARQLLTHAPAWLRTSEAGDALSLLASRAEEEAHVSGRLVGVVVGGPDQLSKARSAALAAGLMQGLEGAGQAAGVSLVFEGSDGGIKPALASLRGQGAVVLIGAMDPVSSLEALAFAESRRVPIVVLASPPQLSADRLEYGFDFGTGIGEQRGVVEEALTQAGALPMVFVGPTDTPCPAFESRPGQSTLPLAAWKEAGVRAIGLFGDARCAEQVMSEAFALPSRPMFVLGLEAGTVARFRPTASRQPLRVAHVAVGRFPELDTVQASDRFQEGEATEVRTSRSFFEAMGRDLAALLRVALSGVPTSTESAPEEVRKLHERARDGLLQASAPLLTTKRTGFQGRHQIERKLEVIGMDAP